MGYAKNSAEMINATVAAGAASDTAITITGMVAADTVFSVVNLTDNTQISLAGLVEATNSFTITASTAVKTLLVFWIDRSVG